MLRSVTSIWWLWELPKQKYSKLAFMSSKQRAEHGDNHCWYVKTQQWFESYGLSINALPPSQYSLDWSHLYISKVETNRKIWNDVTNLENGRTWTTYMAINALLYGHTSILCAAQCERAVTDIFNHLEIEVNRYAHIHLKKGFVNCVIGSRN